MRDQHLILGYYHHHNHSKSKVLSYPWDGCARNLSVSFANKQFFAVYWVVLPPRGPYFTTTLAFFPVNRYLKSVGPKFVPCNFIVAPPLVSRL